MSFINWLKGLLAAGINGAAVGITTVIVAPIEFNLEDGKYKLLTVTLVSALFGMASYLAKSPLPEKKDV